jgi:ankyrin repeat protein
MKQHATLAEFEKDAQARLLVDIRSGHIPAIRSCLDASADINQADSLGWTPLMWSVWGD